MIDGLRLPACACSHTDRAIDRSRYAQPILLNSFSSFNQQITIVNHQSSIINLSLFIALKEPHFFKRCVKNLNQSIAQLGLKINVRLE